MNTQQIQFSELEFQPHPGGFGGVQSLTFFENGFGASVVKFMVGAFGGSYGASEGLWELAVIEGDKDSWEITYDTPITDDVLGRLNEVDVTRYLNDIIALPKKKL